MQDKWNKTYNHNGFDLKTCRDLNLTFEDLGILRWFLDFYPLMQKTCNNNKEYGWVNYKYLIHNLQIIYCQEESLAKRFTKYCDLGLLEKFIQITKFGKKVYFRSAEKIVFLYSHTDKNRDAQIDKNPDVHTDKNRDAIDRYNSSTKNSSTIDSEKIYKKETDSLKSFQQIETFFQNKCTDSTDENLEIINNDFSKEEISLLAEFAINRIKGKNNIKNTKTALKTNYNIAIHIKASLSQSNMVFSEIFRKVNETYIYLQNKEGLTVDSLKPWIVDAVLKDKQIKQNVHTNQDYLDKKVEKLITEIKSELLEYPDDFYNRSAQLKRTAEDWKIIENNSKIHEKYNIKDYRFVLDYILEIKQPCGKKGVPRAEFISSYKNEFINMYGESSVLALYNYFIATKDEKFFPSVEDYGK